MTPEQYAMQEKWQNEIMSVSRAITIAQVEYDDAKKFRLEKQHKLEELKTRLKQLGDRGPFGDEDAQPSLFGSEPEGAGSDDSIRRLKLPARLYGLLEKAGISTFNRLELVVNGLDPEFSSGLRDVPSLDEDAINRILGEYNDLCGDDDDTPSTIPYAAPIQEPKEGTPKNTESSFKIVVKVDLKDAGINKGDTVAAEVHDSGQAFVQYGPSEEDVLLLESNEFELVGADA
ncbi:hypothetical protein SH501x_000806 [Pirellulaceae bacterium SH501]